MHRLHLLAALALLVIAGLVTQRIASASHAEKIPGRGPVVVELFTSEGCSSCPPADAFLRELDAQGTVEGVEVIALGWHVDYWDRLGWKDRFSAAEYSRRQQEYAAAFGNEQVYTPQVVVDGREEFVGSSRHKVRNAILRAAARHNVPVTLAVESLGPRSVGFQVALPASHDGNRRVILVLTESNLVSRVAAGENRGETIHHAAVVRGVKVLAATGGQAAPQKVRFDLREGWNAQHLRGILLMQDARSGAVLGAAQVRVR